MEAKCPRCGTTGRIDDSKIPEKGASAKCPKCGMKFFIQKETSKKLTPKSPPIAKSSNKNEAHETERINQIRSVRENTTDRKNQTSWTLLLILAVIVFAIWFYRGSISEWMAPWSAPSTEVSAIQLMKEYSEDEIAADIKYKGKVIIVSGEVRSRSRDLLQDIFVLLYAENGILSIQCYFSDKRAREVVKLKKGQSVKIKGMVDGKLGNVFLRNCSVVNP